MKKLLLFSLITTIAISARSQKTGFWENQNLTGKQAKITSTGGFPRFSITLLGALPIGGLAAQNVGLSSLQMAAFAPGTMELLSEKIGSPFFIGDPSGQKTESFEMSGSNRAAAGWRVGLRLGNRFEIRGSAQHVRSRWSGRFPVTFLPHQQDPPLPPRTIHGELTSSLSGVLTEIEWACFFAKVGIRPFLRAGFRGFFTIQNELEAVIAGVSLPLENGGKAATFSPSGGAGIRAGFLKNGFFDAAVTFGQVTRGAYSPSAEAAIGWKF